MSTFKITLDIWRQKNGSDPGRFARYQVTANEHMSFLEMLDVLNQDLITKGEEPVAFDNDCREGICGMCGFLINGSPHGPVHGGTVCQLHMRHFKDGDVLRLEPWRAKAFPVLRDLVVDRTAFDRIIQAGGFISPPHRRRSRCKPPPPWRDRRSASGRGSRSPPARSRCGPR